MMLGKTPPLAINGWTIFVHPLFLGQLDALIANALAQHYALDLPRTAALFPGNPNAGRIEGLAMNPCHGERSETSLDMCWHSSSPEGLRFFSSVRMTNRKR